MPRVLFIRRAETEANAGLRYGGQEHVPLNDAGLQQAQATARRLRGEQITRLATSPLVRASETAAVLGRELRVAPEPTAALRDLTLNAWEPLSPEELYRRFPDRIREFASNPARPVSSGGESYAQLLERVGGWLAACQQPGVATVAAVTHGAVIRAALHHVIGLQIAAFPTLVLDLCGITELRSGPAGWRLHTLNETTHVL